MTNNKQKHFLAYYLISVVCAGLLISSAVLTNNYRKSMADTYTKLQQVRANMVKIRADLAQMKTAAALMKRDGPSGISPSTAERRILLTVDDLNTRLKAAELTVSAFTRNNQEVHLPISIKGSFDDYSQFLNLIGSLQAMNGPFFPIESLSISVEGGASDKTVKPGGVNYDLKGTLKMISAKGDGQG